jgi:hypothetical protein
MKNKKKQLNLLFFRNDFFMRVMKREAKQKSKKIKSLNE